MNLKKHFIQAISGAIIIASDIVLCGCKHDKVPEIIHSCNFPEKVSFNNDIIPVLKNSCSTSGCHTGLSPAGNLNLDDSVAYKKLMKHGSGYIDTINPNYSLLYSQMISSSTPMPPSGKLSDCKILLVLQWIQQKAKNN